MIRRIFLLATFLAAGSALAEGVAGKWNFVWQTPGGERRSTLTITVDNEKATLLMPDAKKPMTGTYKEGKLAVAGQLYSAEAGQDGQFRLSGTLSGDELRGSASWAEHEMTFTARRAE